MTPYININYTEFAVEVISFPEFLIEKNYILSVDVYEKYKSDYLLDETLKNLFSEYIQKMHTDLAWVTDVIEEHKLDMYFHLLHIANVALKINETHRVLSMEEQLVILLSNFFQFQHSGIYDVELSQEKGQEIPNYGYLTFLEFKKYLLHKDSIKKSPKLHYSAESISLFSGNTALIDLLHYFNENFSSLNGRFSANTKFNQIYFYLKHENDTDTLNERRFIDFIRSEIDDSYFPTRITSPNQDHMNTLQGLHQMFLKRK